jgi:hypothetical protein
MKEHQVDQGAPEWLALRLGIPTASELDKIVTSGGKLLKSSRVYALRLATETLLNRTLDSLDHMEWIGRGKELEPEAVRAYEFQHEAETRAVGFVTTDDGRIGASPDRLIVGKRGGLEVKCPAPHTHIGYRLDGFGTDYRVQVQGQMLVAELEWVDRWSFHPEMPGIRDRTPRDEPFIRLLDAALDEFCDMKDAMLEEVRAKGFFAARERVLTPAEIEYGERHGLAPIPGRLNNGFDRRIANSGMPFV